MVMPTLRTIAIIKYIILPYIDAILGYIYRPETIDTAAMQSTKPIIADCLKLFLNVFLKSEKIKECFSKVYFLITLVSPAVAGPIRIINIRTQILPEINAVFVLKILLTKQIHARTNGIKKIE